MKEAQATFEKHYNEWTAELEQKGGRSAVHDMNVAVIGELSAYKKLYST
jgi:hypothetical protein